MEHGSARTSFVIATRNRVDELQRTIHRLLETPACPIVVVDNGSDDNTTSMVDALRRSHTDGSRVLLIGLGRNKGAAARNIGVAACGTPFAAFCDDDSWWEPRATRIAERLFDHHPSVGLLAGQTTVWPTRRR